MTNQLIRHRWPTSESFYAERDHRTLLEVKSLHSYVNRAVEICVSREEAHDPTVQRIALLTTNLTARWARNVHVSVPDVSLAEPLRIHGDQTLRDRIVREMQGADPFGVCDINDARSTHPDPLRLFIGPGCEQSSTEMDYVVDASGWSALGQRSNSRSTYSRSPAAVSAAALAAAIGSADLFKRAIGHPRERWLGRLNWCTWDHTIKPDWCCPANTPAIPSITEVGDLLVAGVGAIGSALLYILSLGPLQGSLVLLDRDSVDASNLNRSPMFMAVDAAGMAKKVDVALRFLASTGIKAKTLHGTWRTHGQGLGQERFDAWVSLTNEDGAWAEVPFQLPPIVLHGTTTSGWGIAFGRHIPRIEDCTACRLPRPSVEFRGPCAEGEVPTPAFQPQLRASLPFLSTASAALIAGELLRLQQGISGLSPNAVSADFAFGLPSVIALRFGSNATCRGCRMARLPLWIDRGGRSRYVSLSSPT
jgi:hypothetical protein